MATKQFRPGKQNGRRARKPAAPTAPGRSDTPAARLPHAGMGITRTTVRPPTGDRSAPPSPERSPDAARLADTSSLAWLQSLLQQAMTGLIEADAPSLQKANAMARLGGLYLKAEQITELQRENRALTRRVAELEQANAGQAESAAALEARLAAIESALAAPGSPPAAISAPAAPDGAAARTPGPVAASRLDPPAAVRERFDDDLASSTTASALDSAPARAGP